MGYFQNVLNKERSLYNTLNRYSNLMEYERILDENIGKNYRYGDSKPTIVRPQLVDKLNSLALITYRDLTSADINDLKSKLSPDELEELISTCFPFFDNHLSDEETRELVCFHSLVSTVGGFNGGGVILNLYHGDINKNNFRQVIPKGAFFDFANIFVFMFEKTKDLLPGVCAEVFKILYETLSPATQEEYKTILNLADALAMQKADYDFLKLGEIYKEEIEKESTTLQDSVAKYYEQPNGFLRDRIKNEIHTSLNMLEGLLNNKVINEETFIACLCPAFRDMYEEYKAQK